MAWQEEMTMILRSLVNDVAETTYTDEALEQTLLVAGYQVVNEQMTFPNLYTISVSGGTLTPDPTNTATLDGAFVNLVTLKAACIIDRGAAMTAAGQAIAVRDGSSAIDLRGVLTGRLELLKKGGYCFAYGQAKQEYQSGVALLAGEMVSTPFRTWYSSCNESGPPLIHGGRDGENRQ